MNVDSCENQRIKGKLVEKEVLQNCSELIDTLIEQCAYGKGSLMEYETELFSIQTYVNYYTAANRELEEMTNKEATEYLIGNFGVMLGKGSGKKQLQKFLSKNENCFRFCSDQGVSPDYDDALEFWIVSKWLGKKLKEHGESVEEIFSLTIWGRTCTGQPILLDSVITDICRDLDLLVENDE